MNFWPFHKPLTYFKHNGYQVILQRTDSPSANIRIIVNAGAIDEPADSFGTAHFLEHMFFKGTKKRDYKQVNKDSGRLGNINAYTTRDRTVYHLTHLPENFDAAADLLLEMVFEPAFPADEFYKEQGVILQECQTGLDNPQRHFFMKLNEWLYGSQYGHPTIGSMKSIADTTVEKLNRFINRWYAPPNMALAVCGNVSEKQVRKLLDRLPSGESEAPVRKRSPKYSDFHCHHHAKQATFAFLCEGVHTPGNPTIGVFNNGLGGGMHSLLFDRVREELGLCYAIFSYNDGTLEGGTQVIFSMLDEKDIPQAQVAIQSILANVRRRGFDPELLDVAKENFLFDAARRFETASSRNHLVDTFFQLGDCPLSEYLDFTALKRKVRAITNDDIIALANKLYGEGEELMVAKQTEKK